MMKKILLFSFAFVLFFGALELEAAGIKRKVTPGRIGADGAAGAAGATGAAGPAFGTTTYFSISIGGEVVASSAVVPFFPGDQYDGAGSTCTITEYWFETMQPSQGSATFGMFAVAQSSWQFSVYTGPGISTGARASPVVTGVAIVIPSTATWSVGVASAAIGMPAAEFAMKVRKWCGRPSGAP